MGKNSYLFSIPYHRKEQLLICNPGAVYPSKYFFFPKLFWDFEKSSARDKINVTKHKNILQHKLRFPNSGCERVEEEVAYAEKEFRLDFRVNRVCVRCQCQWFLVNLSVRNRWSLEEKERNENKEVRRRVVICRWTTPILAEIFSIIVSRN